MASAEVEDDIGATPDSTSPDAASPDSADVQNEEVPVTSNCSILALNQDCLLKIFGYLKMRDLLSIEKVCPYWKDVVALSWRRFTMFDCSASFHNYLDDSFKKCLIRCGPTLKKIYFPALVHDGRTCELLGIIAKHCPNVECIVLNETRFQKRYARNFTRILNRLKCLEFECSNFELDYTLLKQLIKRVTKLESLTFKGYDTKNPADIKKIFQFLPKSLTKVDFGSLSYPCANFFVLLQRYCPNLEALSLSGDMSDDLSGDTSVPISKFTKLRELELHYSEIDIGYMENLLPLNQLEKLVLTCPSEMNDEFLEKIVESLPLLRHLDIHASDDREITDKGVEKLAQLEHLEHLNLSYYDEITHKGIGAVAAKGKLKQLILISTLVADSVISAVLTHCHELEFLDLSACSEITEEAINALLEIFTTTNKRAKLTVIVGGTEYVKCETVKDEENEEQEQEENGPKDLFATNLTILSNTNFVKSWIQRRYGEGDSYDDSEFDDDFGDSDYDFSDNDFYDEYDYEDPDFLYNSDDSSAYEFQFPVHELYLG